MRSRGAREPYLKKIRERNRWTLLSGGLNRCNPGLVGGSKSREVGRMYCGENRDECLAVKQNPQGEGGDFGASKGGGTARTGLWGRFADKKIWRGPEECYRTNQ